MPAKRHGRTGKARRPRLNESPLHDVAQDDRAHPAMRMLAAGAARRGLSVRELAKLVKRAPESLMRSLYAPSPRLNTVEDICDSMRLGRPLARALLGMVDARYAYNLQQAVLRTVLGRRAIFDDALAVQNELVAVLDAAPLEKRYAALAAFALAVAGINVPTGPGFDLAPELFALARGLGFDLAAHVVDSARFAEERESEMLAARDWALQAFPLSPYDREAIEAIFSSYVKPSDQAAPGALRAAIVEYRRHLSLAGVLAGFTPKKKGPKK